MAARRFCAIGISVASLFVAIAPAAAETPLRYANITAIRNQVRMLPRNRQARAARVSDFLVWGDGMATARSSRADVKFNDGSRVRFGQQVVFRFEPGTRRVKLTNGTVLLLIPPRQGRTTLQTPNAVTGIQGSGLFVRYDAEKNQTIVGALTESGIQVSRADGTGTQTLHAGQIVVIAGNEVRPVAEFDLKSFYRTSPLAEGFQLDQANVNDGDTAIAQVRAETLAGLAAQRSFTPTEASVATVNDFRLGSLDRNPMLDWPQVGNVPITPNSPVSDALIGQLPSAQPGSGLATVNNPTNNVVVNTTEPSIATVAIDAANPAGSINQPNGSNSPNLANQPNPSNRPNGANQPNSNNQPTGSNSPNLANQPNASNLPNLVNQPNGSNSPNLVNQPNPSNLPNGANQPNPNNQPNGSNSPNLANQPNPSNLPNGANQPNPSNQLNGSNQPNPNDSTNQPNSNNQPNGSNSPNGANQPNPSNLPNGANQPNPNDSANQSNRSNSPNLANQPNPSNLPNGADQPNLNNQPDLTNQTLQPNPSNLPDLGNQPNAINPPNVVNPIDALNIANPLGLVNPINPSNISNLPNVVNPIDPLLQPNPLDPINQPIANPNPLPLITPPVLPPIDAIIPPIDMPPVATP
jgi:FecR protein